MKADRRIMRIYKDLFRVFGPQYWWPGKTPFEIAVGAILTQNTNWGNVERAISNLKTARVLSAKKMHKMPINEIASLIKPAGYFNIKAKRLKTFICFLTENYRGNMRRMGERETSLVREELLSVHGIGPETADSILLYGLGKTVFVIDAYTRRVLSRHGIISHAAPYEEIQKLFHVSLRRDASLYNEYHALFVKVGKEFCRPRPLCGPCPLSSLGEAVL